MYHLKKLMHIIAHRVVSDKDDVIETRPFLQIIEGHF